MPQVVRFVEAGVFIVNGEDAEIDGEDREAVQEALDDLEADALIAEESLAPPQMLAHSDKYGLVFAAHSSGTWGEHPIPRCRVCVPRQHVPVPASGARSVPRSFSLLVCGAGHGDTDTADEAGRGAPAC